MQDKSAAGSHGDSAPFVDAQIAAGQLPGYDIMPQFVNRFVAVADPSHTRIVFGDAAIGINATFHTSVVMSTSDAIALANLILELTKMPDPGSMDTSGSSQAIAMEIADADKKPK